MGAGALLILFKAIPEEWELKKAESATWSFKNRSRRLELCKQLGCSLQKLVNDFKVSPALWEQTAPVVLELETEK